MIVIRRGRSKIFEAENAVGLLHKSIGLMGRKKLAKGRGMIFSFPFDFKWSMWMFGMRMPLDIVFINKDRKIIQIERGVKPVSLDFSTWKTIRSNEVCRHVLEINSGEASRKRIKAGDMLSFTGD